MPRLIPPFIDKNCKSSGEKMLFDIFKNSSFANDWIILHSLNLSKHTKRSYGEIDFLILIPGGGIFVMEVKSGNVKCNNGVWNYTDRFNNTALSSVGPFNQARDAMYSLLAAIETEYGVRHDFTKIMFGFLCAFPHISFNKHSIEYESWQILDKDSIQFGLDYFFKNLIGQFIQKHSSQQWFSKKTSLPDINALNELCDFLRGDFERVRPIRDRLDEFNEEVKSYTKEQYRVLDHIQINDRSIIQGSAGTGKTMIALESAIRAASEGKRVFITCFNRLIGEWMQKQLSESDDNIVVSSLHSFLINESKGFDYDNSLISRQDFYTKYLPSLLREIYNKGINNKFDKLIIDEGQDLIREEYLSLFDAMLQNGLSEGNWEIYGDFERQAIYSQLSKDEMFSLINRYSRPSKFYLKINCRNTKQIGEETSLISGFKTPPFLLEFLEGIPVEYTFYNNHSHQKQILKNQLDALTMKGLAFNEVVILSPKKFENSCSNLLGDGFIKEIKYLKEISCDRNCFGYATIQSYKGMESNYIFITDIEDLISEHSKSLLYVGMSRARFGLYLFISESVKDQYKEILKNKLYHPI